MKTFRIDTNSNFLEHNTNLAIGNFDGIHIGHQKIIQKLIKESKKKNIKSSILSFSPHPRQYFTNKYENFSITDEETKIILFNQLKIDNYIAFKFDKILASFSPKQFIEKILYEMLKIKNLTVGYDFKFGKDRKGDIDLLKKLSPNYNFNLTIIEQVIDPDTQLPYSSSDIRKNIQKGKFEKVNHNLGRNWSVKGIVVSGDKRAREMNFPTANIMLLNQIYPKKGVYAIKAKLNENYYQGIANFGERPTVEGKNLLLEVHLFDFKENIYGKELTVDFLTFIRGEKKFENFELLKEQIKKDIEVVKSYYRKK